MSSKSNNAAPANEPKRVLGRGLSALIPATSRPAEQAHTAPAPTTSAADDLSGLRFIPLVKIALNPFQPRQEFSTEQLAELTESIKQHGVLQPVVVRPKGKTTFELVAGERRFRAATQAGLKEIPAIVRDIDDKSSLAIALIENIQRQELNPVESARAFQRLLTEFHLTQTELALEVGKSQPSIANALRLLSLPESILDSLSSGAITEGHAKALLSVELDDHRIALWKAVLQSGLNVRETERRAAATKTIPRGITFAVEPARPTEIDLETDRLEQQLSLTLGTKVKIRFSGREKGRIELEFYALDHLEDLLQKLNVPK